MLDVYIDVLPQDLPDLYQRCQTPSELSTARQKHPLQSVSYHPVKTNSSADPISDRSLRGPSSDADFEEEDRGSLPSGSEASWVADQPNQRMLKEPPKQGKGIKKFISHIGFGCLFICNQVHSDRALDKTLKKRLSFSKWLLGIGITSTTQPYNIHQWN